MNSTLAEYLADLLRPLPFVGRVVGLARQWDELKLEEFDNADKPTTQRIRLPYPLQFPLDTPDCDRNERFLLPDANTASGWFFEDLGTVDVSLGNNTYAKESTLRLLGWLNPKWFAARPDEAAVYDALSRALLVRQPQTLGDYQKLVVTASILPGEAALFGKYTYATDVAPLLYPPYQLFGLELKCRYFYKPCPVPLLPTLLDYPSC